MDREQEGLAWQVDVWDRMSDVYVREIDQRFEPVVKGVMERAALQPGERVLDLGTGTGAIAELASPIVGPSGRIMAVDISPEMLALADQRLAEAGVANVELREGRGEDVPADADAFDVVLASLSMMFVIDRAQGAREIARVLRPGGRFVGSVWAGPEQCDLIRFQQTAGRFSATPPVPGVGPGALGDPSSFVEQLKSVGIEVRVETETFGFDLPDFSTAWETFATVTAGDLSHKREQEAKDAVFTAMYPNGDGPRHFRNDAHFIIGELST